jgi:hypothetical protein
MTIKSWSGQVLKAASYDEEIVFLNSVFRFFGKYLAQNFVHLMCNTDTQHPAPNVLFLDAVPDRLFITLGIRFNACTSDDVQ